MTTRFGAIRAFVFGLAVLSITAAVVFAATAWMVQKKSDGVLAAGVASGVCWLASMCGLVVFVQQRGWEGEVFAAFAPMVIRLFLSLIALAVLLSSGGSLARAGVGGMVVVNYLALLVAEILVFVRLTAAGPSQAK